MSIESESKNEDNINQESGQVKVDSKGQNYSFSPGMPIQRLDSNGNTIKRIRLSKKERLKLRQKYREIKEMKPLNLANNILEKSNTSLSSEELK